MSTTTPTKLNFTEFVTDVTANQVKTASINTTGAVSGTLTNGTSYTFTVTATAQGIAISSGWIGLAVSSRVIGSIAGGDPKRLRKALLVIPAASVVMVIVNLALRGL